MQPFFRSSFLFTNFAPSTKALSRASLLCLLSVTSPFVIAGAQSATTGAISGTITDTNGALLPATVVTIKSIDTGVTRTVKANSSGEFRVTELLPGIYTATITADGFQTYQENTITVTVGGISTVSPKLTVGSVADKVEVTDETPELHTQDNAISTTIDQNAIDNLPINGRRWSNFALLTPGVVSNSDGFGLLSFRGISYLLNNNTIDGADDNQAYFSEARGRTRTNYAISQASIQEFQVNTSNYSAEYGRAAGGVINTVTKSGGNKLHGELFFYDRDNSLGGATNPYTLLTTQNASGGFTTTTYKPTDWRKQWGFGVGGPLLRDKLFWFYAYDQSRRNFPGTARPSDTPDLFASATPLSGKESCTTNGSQFSAPIAKYVDPSGAFTLSAGVTANLAGLYPTGAAFEGNTGACFLAVSLNAANPNYQQAMAFYNQGLGILNSFTGTVPRTGDQVINFPKLDYQINDRERLTVQYNRLRWDSPAGVQTQSSNFYGRGSFGNDFVKADFGIVRLTSVVSNSIVNAALVQYGRDLEIETAQSPTPNELPLVNALPNAQVNDRPEAADTSIGFGYDLHGIDIGTNPILNRRALPDERRLQGLDIATWSHGKHTSKAGVDYNKVSDYINNLYNGYGSYDEDWAYSFIGDYLHATTGLGGALYSNQAGATSAANKGLYSSFSQGFGSPIGLITTREYAGFLTDDWRITPNLTLTAGVRYEYEYVPGNPYPNPAYPATSNRPDDRNNAAPRLGFAYNVYGNSKTILRGGYGMYYGRIINSNVLQTYQNSGGPGSQVNATSIFSDSTCAPVYPVILTSLTSANCALAPNISYLDPHLQNPQVHEADLALEQDLGHNVTFSLTYMSSFGRELNSSNDVNVNGASAVSTKFVVVNTPAAAGYAVAPGYTTYPHGGKPAPLPNGFVYTTNVFTGATRLNPSYSHILDIASNVNSNYNALAVQLNRRFSNGFSLLSNFTWSHALDYNPYIGTGVPTYNVFDPTNLKKEYGNSSLDVRRRFVFAAVYQPQTHFHGVEDFFLGGWRIAPILQVQSGLPYTPSTSGYPSITASGFRGINGTGSSANRIDVLGRNQDSRPKTTVVDLRLGKNWYIDRLGEKFRFEIFAEMFNVANHQNITGINNSAYAVSTVGTTNYLTLQPNFGTYNNADSNYTYSPRQIQLAARLHF